MIDNVRQTSEVLNSADEALINKLDDREFNAVADDKSRGEGGGGIKGHYTWNPVQPDAP